MMVHRGDAIGIKQDKEVDMKREGVRSELEYMQCIATSPYLTELPTGVGQGVLPVHKVPAILIACIVLNPGR